MNIVLVVVVRSNVTIIRSISHPALSIILMNDVIKSMQVEVFGPCMTREFSAVGKQNKVRSSVVELGRTKATNGKRLHDRLLNI